MSGIPPYMAFLLGTVIGIASYGPVKRWVAGLRRARAAQAERPDAQREDSRLLLLIFATMHPAPWALIFGVPFALYQLTLGPLPMMWLRLIAGMTMVMALIFVYENKLAGRSRRR
jgi:hypothetical protein